MLAMLLPSGSAVCSAKRYIVAVLVGVLFAMALAAVVSIALAPAHISFSVADPGMPVLLEEGEARRGRYYCFTLVAENLSRRMSVSYGGYLYIEVWPSDTAWIPGRAVNYSSSSCAGGPSPSLPAPAKNDDKQPLQDWQRPGTTTNVTIHAESWQFEQQQPQEGSQQDIIHARHDANSTVVVKAEVRFKLGFARTMPYTIAVTCSSVNFTKNGTDDGSSVKCKI